MPLLLLGAGLWSLLGYKNAQHAQKLNPQNKAYPWGSFLKWWEPPVMQMPPEQITADGTRVVVTKQGAKLVDE